MTTPLNVDLVWVKVTANDPNSSPREWSYTVVDPINNKVEVEASLNLSGATPTDLLKDQMVELTALFPLSVQQGVPAALKGKGIQSMAVNGSNRLIVTYDDGSTQDAGVVPVLTGPASPSTFTQATPQTVWTINHNLGRYPIAWSLYDNTGQLRTGYDVQHMSLNQVRVSMDIAVAGTFRYY